MGNRREIIEGITVTLLRQIEDERGAVFHVLKNTDPHFYKFGEVYFSKVNPGVIKAWKFHKEITQNLCVPYGELKLVIFDDRAESPTYKLINEFTLDAESNYKLISLPARVWYGFQCVSETFCLILNVADMKHDPAESIQEDITSSTIDYKWQS